MSQARSKGKSLGGLHVAEARSIYKTEQNEVLMEREGCWAMVYKIYAWPSNFLRTWTVFPTSDENFDHWSIVIYPVTGTLQFLVIEKLMFGKQKWFFNLWNPIVFVVQSSVLSVFMGILFMFNSFAPWLGNGNLKIFSYILKKLLSYVEIMLYII